MPVITVTSLVSISQANVITTTYDTINNMWVDTEAGLLHRYNGPPFAGRMQATYTAGYKIIPYNVIEGAGSSSSTCGKPVAAQADSTG